MNAFKLVFAISIGLLFSCNTNQEFKSIDKVIKQDSLVPLQRTVIAELPDSLQPKTYLLEDMPKPVVRLIPKGGGDTVMIPIVQNDNGEPILDSDGNPIIKGDGGISNFTTFTIDNGLAFDFVSCSVMDKSGNLWFGTNGGGVSRYDGKSFSNFTTAHGLPSNNVISITQDKVGNIWFGTDGDGVSRYDGSSFTNFTTNEGLSNNFVWRIKEDKNGNIWFGTNGGGVDSFDGKSFTNFSTAEGLAGNVVWSILEDRSGNIWFGTDGGGVSRYNPTESFRTDSISQPTSQSRFKNFSFGQDWGKNRVTSIIEDKSGNLWFGTLGGGVNKFDGKTFSNFSTAHGLASKNILCITEDKSGNLWFGGDGGGVSRYKNGSFTHYSIAEGFKINEVWNIIEDKSGNLWFGSDGEGVIQFEGESFVKLTSSQGLWANKVSSIYEDKVGNLWFASYALNRYDRKSIVSFTKEYGLPINNVWSITGSKDLNLWIGLYNFGILKFDGKTFTNFTTEQGLAGETGQSILEDKYGNLWIGTNGGGISKFDGKSFTNFTNDQGLTNNDVTSILEDRFGNLWFATYSGGVSLYDGKSFTNFTEAHGLVNKSVNTIKEDKSGNIWFGTNQGLSFLDLETYKKFLLENATFDKSIPKWDEGKNRNRDRDKISSSIFKSFGTSDGLANNSVSQIVQLPKGKMAIGTNFGITFFNISKDFSTLTDLEIYHSSTGYPVKDVYDMFLDSKGIIWAGTGSDKTALVRFDYEALHKSDEPPVVVIHSIKVKNENISWHTLREALNNENLNVEDSFTTPAYITEEVSIFGRELRLSERDSMRQRFGKIEFDSITPFYPLPQNLVLPYNLNQLSFEFVAIETSRPQMVKYQYQLEGYDEDWSPVTNRSNASFGNIHEGTYTFKLKAQGANGIWTEPVTYSFTVLPPWYRTWWAYGIYFLFFAGLVWRIHMIQKAKTIRIEREKTKDRELAQAKEIEKAYHQLENAHKDLEDSHKNLKSTQAQLIQSEKMASLGELTAGIAHEIQNPLNFVNNFSEVSNELMEEVAEERAKNQEARDENLVTEILGDVKENLSKITLHGKRADAIVKGMLEHSKRGSGQNELTDLNALAEEFLRLSYQSFLAKNKDFHADLQLNLDSDLPKISVIPQDIGKVLLNLYSNAFYAVNEKRIEGFQPEVIIQTQKTENKIQVSVKDNGSGIPDAIKEKIFQPFFTTKPTGQGTGLGLSLSYDIVKAHGGEINLESVEGKGTAFTMLLPLA